MFRWPDIKAAYSQGSSFSSKMSRQVSAGWMCNVSHFWPVVNKSWQTWGEVAHWNWKPLPDEDAQALSLYLGSLSILPMLLIFQSVIGLQNNWILPRNFNVLYTCDLDEEDISVLAELRKWKCSLKMGGKRCQQRRQCMHVWKWMFEQFFFFFFLCISWTVSR